MRTAKEFKKQDNIILTEIERRLRYFNKPLTERLLIRLLPSEARNLESKGYIILSSTTKKPRQFSWYRLSEKGIDLLSKVNSKPIDEDENLLMFDGKKITDYNLIY